MFKFYYEDTAEFLRQLCETSLYLRMDRDRHSVVASREDEKIFTMRLPLIFPRPQDGEYLQHYLESHHLKEFPTDWNLLIMEAGRAAVGAVRHGKLSRHKNIRRYMVRKKQGKSQLTHLKTRGKSRYGSRLRLQETQLYFHDILDLLEEDEFVANAAVFYHCPVRLKAFLTEAAEERGFNFSQYEWIRFGINVKEASFAELQRLTAEPMFSRLQPQIENIEEILPPIPSYRKK